jgi:hypothetical protein
MIRILALVVLLTVGCANQTPHDDFDARHAAAEAEIKKREAPQAPAQVRVATADEISFAEKAAPEVVKTNLVSPGIAQFLKPVVTVSEGQPETMEVWGDVDSQNRFGGFMRSHYLVRFQKVNGVWVPIDSTVFGR